MKREIVFVPTDRLKPNPKNPYSDPDDPALDQDIKQNGIRKSLIITADYVIMDGERRWRRASKFEIEKLPCEIRSFDGTPDELAIVQLNLYRRKTPSEIYKESKILEKHLKPLAQIKQGQRRDLLADLPKSRPIHIRDEIAKQLPVSSRQLHKINTIYEHEEEYPEVAEKVSKGELSVHAGYTQIQTEELESEEVFAKRFTNTFSNHIAQIVKKDFPVIVNHMNEEQNCDECHMKKACEILLQSFINLRRQLPTCMQDKL